MIRHAHTRTSYARTLLYVALCIAATAAISYGRAGGGGGYSGGGGGGFSGGGFSSGGGSSGGGGDLIFLLVHLCIRQPLIGIPITGVVIAFFVLSAKSGRGGYVSHTIRRAHRARTAGDITAGLAAIRQRDPTFSPEGLAKRAGSVFPTVQNAWSDQDMKPARHFVSDGIYERFTIQLEIQKACELRNVMRDVQVRSSRCVALHSDAFFDTAHILIAATAVDYTAHARTGKRVDGNPQAEPFSEVWSFVRRPGARTLARPGLLEGHCPSCAAPVRLSDAVECSSCGTGVNSGEYDWVLAEITQLEEWTMQPDREIPGLAGLMARDPAFNPQHVEDRTSVIFWRLRAAEFFARPDFLRGMALPSFMQSSAGRFTQDAEGRHTFFADAAVGGVELVGIESREDSGTDVAYLNVKWSGHEEAARIPGFLAPNFEASRSKSNVFALTRSKSVQSVAERSLTGNHCTACGAPQSASGTEACSYCGAVQNDGSSGWVLKDIQPFVGFFPGRTAGTEPCARQPVTVLSQADSERLLQCAYAVMLADGLVDAKERKQLTAMAARRGIGSERLDQLTGVVDRNGLVDAIEAGESEANREFLRALVVMCLADGNVSSSERRLLKTLTRHMGYAELDIDMMIRSERGRLYREAKESRHAA